jgi:sugar/nucleoside kinase (ribokinase family)
MPKLIGVAGYFSMDDIDVAGQVHQGVPGGAALYAALGGLSTGVRVALLVTVGRDFPREILEALEDYGADLQFVRFANCDSRRSVLEYDDRFGRRTLQYTDSMWIRRTEELQPPMLRNDFYPDVILLCPVHAATAGRYIEATQGQRSTTRIVMDTSEYFAYHERDQILSILDRVDLFVPSREETRLLVPECGDEAALEQLAKRCRGWVVQKRGSQGLAALDSKSKESLSQPPEVATLADVTGAGDSCVGAMAAALSLNLRPREMLTLGCKIAAMTIGGLGPSKLFDFL